MTLPKAVAAATEELAALEQQLQAPAPETPPPDGQTEDTHPIPEPSPEPAQAAPVASTDVPPEVPEEKWEHKYRRLQGKYDAEVPRLHQQVKELQAALQQMQHQVQQAPPPPPPPEKPAEPERYVSDEDVANYGEDFVDIQRRITLDATRELRKQVEELKTQLAQQGSQVQSVSFEARLLKAVPDFEQINADPAWIEWLNEVDPLLRGPRRAIAQQAYLRGDVEAVKSYVDLWRKSQAPAQPAPAVSRQQELQRQVQPSRATTSAPSSGAKKTYTLGEAEALFNRIQNLTAQGRIDEAKRLDAEISAAYAEGRISV